MDEYARYCLLDVIEEDPKGYLAWWKRHEAEFPRLARMARDIFSIPGMSAEVERLFSSVKHMLGPTRAQLGADGIQASEAIRSWTKAKLILQEYFEYLTPQQLAGEKRVKADPRVEQFRAVE